MLQTLISQTQAGIHNGDLYTTAYDLSLIAKYAMNIQKFRDIVKTTNYTIPPTNLHPETDRSFKNSNLLLSKDEPNYYYEYANGIKTGFTNEAGDCLVASAKKGDLEFIVLCLKSGSQGNGLREKFLDCKTLFDFAFANYTLSNENLQEENLENPNQNVISNPIESAPITEIKETESFSTIFHFYRFMIKIIALLVIIIAIKLLFFTKKKNHRRLFKRRKR